MKYLVVLCDGMADTPNAALGGKTPMECAHKPNMDALAKNAEVGMCRTVAAGLKPGSDVANLSVMGYDPAVCYTGRSPLEAASIGVDLKPTDVALRCNTAVKRRKLRRQNNGGLLRGRYFNRRSAPNNRNG